MVSRGVGGRNGWGESSVVGRGVWEGMNRENHLCS